MDIEAFSTVTATIAVAIICGIATYRVAIWQVRKEIAEAFQEHIERMHADHQQFVQAVKAGDARAKE